MLPLNDRGNNSCDLAQQVSPRNSRAFKPQRPQTQGLNESTILLFCFQNRKGRWPLFEPLFPHLLIGHSSNHLTS